MTIIDRINLHLPLVKAEQANTILLGRLECKAFQAAFELIYQQQISLDELMSLNFVFRGMQIVPVAATSLFAVAKIVIQEQDETIRV